MRQKKFTISFIAGTIGVSVSTVCRELKPNSDSKGGDDGQRAVLKTMRRRAKSPGNRSIPPYVRSRVFELIRKQQWSPEQVSGWLKREEGLAVSKYAIYNWIAGSSPHCKDSIHKHLRHGGKRCRNSAQGPRIPITNRVSIDERPAEANGQTLGDWEMDTIVGKDGKGAIVNLVERKSACMLMEKLDTGRQAIPLADAVVRLLKNCPLPVRTITTDNGTEFAAHEKITSELKAKVYFTHPYSSWKKGR